MINLSFPQPSQTRQCSLRYLRSIAEADKSISVDKSRDYDTSCSDNVRYQGSHQDFRREHYLNYGVAGSLRPGGGQPAAYKPRFPAGSPRKIQHSILPHPQTTKTILINSELNPSFSPYDTEQTSARNIPS